MSTVRWLNYAIVYTHALTTDVMAYSILQLIVIDQQLLGYNQTLHHGNVKIVNNQIACVRSPIMYSGLEATRKFWTALPTRRRFWNGPFLRALGDISCGKVQLNAGRAPSAKPHRLVYMCSQEYILWSTSLRGGYTVHLSLAIMSGLMKLILRALEVLRVSMRLLSWVLQVFCMLVLRIFIVPGVLYDTLVHPSNED